MNSLAFSPDGRTIASGTSVDGTFRLWEIETGRHLDILTGHIGDVNSVVFSPDGGTIASGGSDGTVLLWDITPLHSREDINIDGVVDVLDLTLVASNFGQQGHNAADVNGDGIIDILDLVLVASAFGDRTTTL